MTEREYEMIQMRDDYLLGRTTQKWTLKKIGELFGVSSERARQIYTKAKHKQLAAYTRRIKEKTGEVISYHDLETEMGNRANVSQYLERRYGEVLQEEE